MCLFFGCAENEIRPESESLHADAEKQEHGRLGSLAEVTLWRTDGSLLCDAVQMTRLQCGTTASWPDCDALLGMAGGACAQPEHEGPPAPQTRVGKDARGKRRAKTREGGAELPSAQRYLSSGSSMHRTTPCSMPVSGEAVALSVSINSDRTAAVAQASSAAAAARSSSKEAAAHSSSEEAASSEETAAPSNASPTGRSSCQVRRVKAARTPERCPASGSIEKTLHGSVRTRSAAGESGPSQNT